MRAVVYTNPGGVDGQRKLIAFMNPGRIAFDRQQTIVHRVAKERPRTSIICVTPSDTTYRRMALVWGVTPLLIPEFHTIDEMLATVQDEGERLNRFVANLLDMTRLDSGTIALKRAMVDLSDIVGAALQRVAKSDFEHR